MGTYYKNLSGDYITAIGTGSGDVEITQEEYDQILSVIRSRPEAGERFEYQLRLDLTWELMEVPPAPEEDPEATDEDYQAALRDMGVEIHE
jgi:hypothetical protein